jgi:hypothetical protein
LISSFIETVPIRLGFLCRIAGMGDLIKGISPYMKYLIGNGETIGMRQPIETAPLSQYLGMQQNWLDMMQKHPKLCTI